MTRLSLLLRRLVVLSVVMALSTPGVKTASSGAAPSDTTTPSIRWLAAGDSFSSGEGISGVTGDCAQASTAWASKVKSTLESGKLLKVTEFEFQACSGATIEPPPHDPTSTNTWAQQRAKAIATATGPYDLITFTFGGNDLGFASRIFDCLGAGQLLSNQVTYGQVGPVVTLFAHRCTFNRSDLLAQINAFQTVLESFFKKLLADQAVLAPGGQLVVAGYPRLFADPKDWSWYRQGYCWGIHSDDATMINDGVVQLNAVIASAILATDPARIRYVNVNNHTSGFPAHGLCSKNRSWINRWTLGGDVEFSQLKQRYQGSFHPTQAGHDYYAERVSAQLAKLRFKAPVPDPAAVDVTSPCPEGSDCLTELVGDFDGDDRPDRLGLYLAGRRKGARIVLASGRTADATLPGGFGGRPGAPELVDRGIVDADKDGRDEAIVQTNSGGNTFYPVVILKLDGERLVVLGEPNQPDEGDGPSFFIDYGLYHKAGLRCDNSGTDGRPRLEATSIIPDESADESGQPVSWTWEVRRYRWLGAALKLETSETGTISGVDGNDPRIAAYGGIRCAASAKRMPIASSTSKLTVGDGFVGPFNLRAPLSFEDAMNHLTSLLGPPAKDSDWSIGCVDYERTLSWGALDLVFYRDGQAGSVTIDYWGVNPSIDNPAPQNLAIRGDIQLGATVADVRKILPGVGFEAVDGGPEHYWWDEAGIDGHLDGSPEDLRTKVDGLGSEYPWLGC